jgi:amino acid adenylation domain-containing protein
MEITMPMATYAVWLAVAGDDHGQTDVLHKASLAEAEAKRNGTRAEYHEYKQNLDSAILSLAAQCARENSLDQAIAGFLTGPGSRCAICPKFLLVIDENDQARPNGAMNTPNDAPDGHGVPTETLLETEGYGVIIRFTKHSHSWKASIDRCAHNLDPPTDKWAHRLERAVQTLYAQASGGAKRKALDEGRKGIQDLSTIWSWNAAVPEAIDGCVHDLFADMATTQPDAPAVCAPDGDLTYRELDSLSTRLAAYLVSDLGVGPGTLVPLCFEKSMWTPVAMLGVMKAGAASIATDTSHPETRLRNIIQQAHANSKQKVILSSKKKEHLAQQLARSFSDMKVAVPEAIVLCSTSASSWSPIKVRAEDLLYVVFTSGSTGTPKGAVITHGNFRSAIHHQQSALGFGETSRVFDYVSYAFDVTWSNALHTLTAGGCLCIPDDADRHGDIAHAINSLRATDAHVTPTVGQLIRPEDVPGLQSMMFIGEKLNESDLLAWRRVPNVRNTYGPAECTVTNTIMRFPDDVTGQGEPSIGRGSGTVTWVVHPDGSELAAVGDVGELWLEGPLIGEGYLANPDKTAEAFIHNPPWLLRGSPGVAGSPGIPGRHGRLYRTGDLVRYNADGTLQFIGRKDDQVKIRGQRVELGDIEHNLRLCLASHPHVSVVAEVSRPSGGTDPILVAFLVIGDAADGTKEETDLALAPLLSMIDDHVANYLMPYMIPSAYIPLNILPLTGTGKTDRRRLREMIASMTLEQLAHLAPGRSSATYQEPSSDAERQLQRLWASALGIEARSISAHDGFFRLGGDSVSAIRLVAAAHAEGLSLSTADVFRCPQLKDLAKSISADIPDVEITAPFALLAPHVEEQTIREQAAACCQIPIHQVLDVYPCTQLQQGLLALTATTAAGAYMAQKVFQIDPEVDFLKLQRAWKEVVAGHDILRTRIVDMPGHGLLQVVCSHTPITTDARSLSDCLTEDRVIDLGSALSYATFVDDEDTNSRYFVWTAHHALYDGWSVPQLLGSLDKAYRGTTASVPTVPFREFVKHTLALDLDRVAEYWRSQLEACKASKFPALPSPTYQPRVDQTIHTSFNLSWPASGITPSNILRSAWALLQARHSDSNDVVFGAVVSGRQASLPGISSLVGPTIATVPVRVIIDQKGSALELQQRIQSQSIEMSSCEQFGLSRIRGLGEAESEAADFQCLLVVQPRQVEHSTGLLKEVESKSTKDLQQLNTYALTVLCHLHDHGVELECNFDSRLLPSVTAKRMADQFEGIVRQLCSVKDAMTKVSDVNAKITTKDQIDIWSWNAIVPEAIDACVHDLFAKVVIRQPDAPAICAWDGDFTYRELDTLSSRLAGHLVSLGVRPGTIIPLLFEKSKWTPLAMLGAMKAGATSVLMDSGHPDERLRAIVEQALANSNERLILSSTTSKHRARKLTRGLSAQPELKVVTPETVTSEDLDQYRRADVQVQPDDLVYIVFTSGSTGTPKGAMISHRNLSSNIHHQVQRHRLGFSSRVFDYPSYAFDAAWITAVQALCSGACMCIPSDEDRLNNPGEAIQTLGANWLNLTPTVWRLVRSRSLPTIKTLLLVGEPLRKSDTEQESAIVESMFNAYGPAECTIESTIGPIAPKDLVLNNIGTGCGVVTWIISTHSSPPSPAAIGEVGELWLEGPLVGQGYLDDPERTAEAFVEDPLWLLQGGPGVRGRRGRLYRTGDLARYCPDGSLQFMGRKGDDQVKIRGQRVELGDVETHIKQLLTSDPGVEVVAEVVEPRGHPSRVLVAFISLRSQNLQTTVAQATRGLNDQLLLRLPRHMIPSAYIPIATLPTTQTGKIDRRQLRTIGEGVDLMKLASDEHSRRKAPSSQMEWLLVQSWMEVLGMASESISVDAPFTRLGGDSITAMQVVSRLRLQSVQLAAAEILRQQTIEAIALKCRMLESSKFHDIHHRDVEVVNEGWTLSPIQRLFFSAHPEGLDHFNQSFLLELQQVFTPDQVREAAASLVSRHPLLRSRFRVNSNGVWEQFTIKADPEVFLFTAHSGISYDDMCHQVQARQQSLSIVDGPVFSVDYFDTTASRLNVLFTAHHLIIDLVSWRIIWQDMEQLLKGIPLNPGTGTSFRRWVEIQEAFKPAKSDPRSLLPFELRDTPDFWDVTPKDNTMAGVEDIHVQLDMASTHRLLGGCNSSLRTQPLDVMVAALMHSLHKLFPDRPAPPIFVEGHGREPLGQASVDLSETVGWFTSLCPVQAALEEHSSIVDAVRLVKDIRKSIVGNGVPYFASQHRGGGGEGRHTHVEFLFNYGGVFQQLEGAQSIFKRVDVGITEVSPRMKRMALVEINGNVVEGMLHMTLSLHRGMKHIQILRKWARSLDLVFGAAAEALQHAPITPTLSDFPLLSTTYNELNSLVTRVVEMGIPAEDIVDLLPCTPLQEGILLGIAKGSATYHITQIWDCMTPDSNERINPQALQSAWRSAISRHSIFSTIFLEAADLQTYIQVQLRSSPVKIQWFRSELDNPSDALEQIESPTFSDASPHLSISTCQSANGAVACRLDISHALIDAVSFPILLDHVAEAYERSSDGQHTPRFQAAPGFQAAVAEIMRTPSERKIEYWDAFLAGVEPCTIPVLSTPANPKGSHDDIAIPNSTANQISAFCQERDLTRSTFLQVAWALALSYITHRQDVCFGYLASGRDMNVEGINEIVGPLINTLTSRIDVGTPATVVLEDTGRNLVNHFEFQHVSLAKLQGSLGLRGQRLFNTALTVRQSSAMHQTDYRCLVFRETYGQDPNEVCDSLLHVDPITCESNTLT